MKFKAPPQISTVFLSDGPVPVDEDGTVTVRDDLSPGDHAALCGAGFAPIPNAPAAPEAKAKPAKEG
ncbi:hypothetical protein ACFOON_15190 [Novosphingobium piscinae]|uniref:Uncharacterized protein n=1 Tax=Novosphingobium piscinae TaxID=1507448 RepID=A0A7X1FXE8_9SPHN|nr:hypothetical protein [Novosphingobium piscinae]MBC2668755.1 hypothetical protein [Novosphingobium piscinae]